MGTNFGHTHWTIHESVQNENSFWRNVVRKHSERDYQDQTGKGIKTYGKTDLFVSEIVGLEHKGQIGKDHPERKKVEEIRYER